MCHCNPSIAASPLVFAALTAHPLMPQSEIFESRQQFLSFLQGNNPQFDELRRAKYSTMMMLYHLHTPDVPAFNYSCNRCSRTIKSGCRWHCEECDFDVCQCVAR